MKRNVLAVILALVLVIALGAPVLAAETQSGSEAEAGDSSFEQQKTDILAAIAEAELPTAEELESKEFTIAGCILTEHQKTTPTAVPEFDPETQISIAAYIDSANELAEKVEALKAAAPEGWSLEEDADFADYNAFTAKFAPVAAAAEIKETRRVYIAAECAAAVLTQDQDPAADFTSAIPYHIYTQAIEVGSGPMEALRVADCIPTAASGVLGLMTPDYIGNNVYDVYLNGEGVVVAFDQVQTDSVKHYKPMEDGTLNVSYFDDEVFPVAEGAKLYYVYTEMEERTVLSVSIEEGSFADLTEDWNDSIRAVYDEDGTIVEAYINPVEEAGEAPAYIDQFNKFDYFKGVTEGFDKVENPYAVDYSLYNPLTDEANTTAKDENAKYPLFVYFHGNSGGIDKNAGPVNNNQVALEYSYPEFQAQFETDTEGVNGCFIMTPRGNNNATNEYKGQSWLTGYRGYTNPYYAMGDESYKGKPVQVGAVIADIKYVVENYPIDPNRIYIAGFSAGGYMTWATLFEGKDMFAAAAPGGAALFPNGVQFESDYSEFELGLTDKLLAVKDVAIWDYQSIEDGTCTWELTSGDFATDEQYFINGWQYVPQMVRSFADGICADGSEGVKGNPLTRVTMFNYLHDGVTGEPCVQHSAEIVESNNVYAEGLTTNEGTALTFMDEVYSTEMPEGYVHGDTELLNNRGTVTDTSISNTDYAYSVNVEFSTAESWGDTFISWLNACGAAKAAN